MKTVHSDINYINPIDPKNSFIPPVSPIKGLYFASRIKREKHHHIKTNTPPGHTFQLIFSGTFEFSVNNEKYRAKEGDILYFHNSEIEEVQGGENGFEIIVVNFDAPALPQLQSRILKANGIIRKDFVKILEMYRKNSKDYIFEIYSLLYKLVSNILKLNPIPLSMAATRSGLWIDIENYIRRNNNYRITLPELGKLFGSSPITIIRSCRKHVGTSPKKRIKSLCMAEGRGLLFHSSMSISEIARHLGYRRIHEFSRDFSRYFNVSPSTLRKKDTAPSALQQK